MSIVSGIDLDAIYSGDKTAIGDAIRLLLQRSKQGVLPVLTDRIIVPTSENSGLMIETELGTILQRSGHPYYTSLGIPFGYANEQAIDFWLQQRLLLGEMIDIGDSWAPSDPFGNGAGGHDSNIGVNRILYRAAPTSNRDIRTIYKPFPNSISGSPNGQCIVIWNDSDYVITFFDRFAIGGTGGSGHTAIINGPIEIGPLGAAILVYDEDYDWPGGSGFGGWRVVGASKEGPWHSYTPSWTAASVNPTLGNGSLTAKYSLTGTTVKFSIRLNIGSTTTLGTGVWSFTLPYTSVAVGATALGAAHLFDSGTANYVGTTIHQTTTTASVVSDGAGNTISATVPFAWVNGDYVTFEGTYEIA